MKVYIVRDHRNWGPSLDDIAVYDSVEAVDLDIKLSKLVARTYISREVLTSITCPTCGRANRPQLGK